MSTRSLLPLFLPEVGPLRLLPVQRAPLQIPLVLEDEDSAGVQNAELLRAQGLARCRLPKETKTDVIFIASDKTEFIFKQNIKFRRFLNALPLGPTACQALNGVQAQAPRLYFLILTKM